MTSLVEVLSLSLHLLYQLLPLNIKIFKQVQWSMKNQFFKVLCFHYSLHWKQSWLILRYISICQCLRMGQYKCSFKWMMWMIQLRRLLFWKTEFYEERIEEIFLKFALLRLNLNSLNHFSLLRTVQVGINAYSWKLIDRARSTSKVYTFQKFSLRWWKEFKEHICNILKKRFELQAQYLCSSLKPDY